MWCIRFTYQNQLFLTRIVYNLSWSLHHLNLTASAFALLQSRLKQNRRTVIPQVILTQPVIPTLALQIRARPKARAAGHELVALRGVDGGIVRQRERDAEVVVAGPGEVGVQLVERDGPPRVRVVLGVRDAAVGAEAVGREGVGRPVQLAPRRSCAEYYVSAA